MEKLLTKQKSKPAFTLIEVLVYILILSIVSGVLANIILSVYRFKTVIEDRVNVNEDLRILVKSIRDDMYFGRFVRVEPTDILVITLPNTAEITYFRQDNRVYRQENGSSAVSITGGDVNVSLFVVTDLSTPDAAGAIQLQLTLENYPAGLIKPLVSESITSTMSLKYI
ncbi:MAG: type II secretion system protein [Candidatus Doudnabacteria bacterium]|nr:type II secretion system protein [Candidatus Doudnabacteria bacterium]